MIETNTRNLMKQSKSSVLMRAVDRSEIEAVEALISLQKEKRMSGVITINVIYKGTALMSTVHTVVNQKQWKVSRVIKELNTII